MTSHNINIKLIRLTGLFVFLSFFFHELAHYLTGELLGYDMTMTMNTVTLSEGVYEFPWQKQLISAAGPIFTILTGIVFFIILKKKDNVYIYMLLLLVFIHRLLPTIVSIFNANDEARVSEYLGIGKMTLPIIVSLFLFGLVYIMAKKHQYNWKFNTISFFIISFYIMVVVMGDQYLIKPMIYN